MVAFSVNKGISNKIAVMVFKILEKNEGMIRRAIGSEVRGYIENRAGIIANKIDTVKEEVWHKVINGFNEQKIPEGIEYEEGIERYTKRTLSTYLKDICSSKNKKESIVNIDMLDGRNRNSENEHEDKATIYGVFQSVINDQKLYSLDHKVIFEEFMKFLAELYLTDHDLFIFCRDCIIGYNDNKLMKKDIVKKRIAKFNNEEQALFNKFKKNMNDFTTIEIESAFKNVEKMRRASDMIDKDKYVEIKYYDISEFLTEGGILSCDIKGEYSTTYFDLSTCSMRGKKTEKSNVDLKTSYCRIANKTNNKKVYKIRIEDYIQYAFDNTNLFVENIETELLKWCGKYYIYVLPSGKRFGFCKSHNEYMTNVKLELLANLVHEVIDGKSVVAMDDTYLYFCPNSKPRLSYINAKMFNGKNIKMKISEAENFLNDT